MSVSLRSHGVSGPMIVAARSVPEKLREQIEGEDWQGWWLAAFRARLQRAERDAVRLYPELLRMVGANDAALEMALRALGVSLEIAQKAVGAYREIEHLDDDAKADYALRGLQEHYAARGKRLVVMDEVSPVANGNGSGSKNGAGLDPEAKE